MLLSSDIIISDTSCLILLNKINELELLKKFGSKIYITKTIEQEFEKPLPNWIEVKSPTNNNYKKILEMDLDSGEASAIALALETENSIIILDDLKGRKIAERLKVKYSGTFGLLLKAKQVGVIKEISPIVEKIKKTNFRFSSDLLKIILKEAGE